MRMISNDELDFVAGGGDPASEMITVNITASRSDAAAVRIAYANAQMAANYISAAAASGAGAVVTGACTIGVGAAVGGGTLGAGAVPAIAAAAKPCAIVGGLAATGATLYVSHHMKRYVDNNY